MKQKSSGNLNGIQECLYYGLFIDYEELQKNLNASGLTEHLDEINTSPHITFAYNDGTQFFHFDKDLIGSRVKVRAVSYAKDEKNEGLKVELIDPPQEILKGIAPGKNLHITISIAKDGQAKNTEHLDFKEIAPFELEGEFDARYTTFDVRRHSESKFVFPFYLKGSAKDIISLDESIWTPAEVLTSDGINRQVELRYLASYIEKIFEYDNDIVHIYHLNEKGMKTNLNLQRDDKLIFSETEREEHRAAFRIESVSAYCFTTGINYLVLSIVYEKEMSLEEIAYAVGKLSYLLQKREQTWKIFREGDREEKPLELGTLLRQTITVQGVSEARWFHIQPNEKGSGFHRLLLEREEEESDSLYFFEIMKGIATWSDSQKDYERILKESIFEISQRQKWAVNSSGVVSFVYAPQEKEQALNAEESQRKFLLGAYQQNVRTNYFEEYILALQERDCFLNFNNEAVTNWKNSGKLIQLKEDILKLNIWATYDVVSTEANYQNFYEKIYKELKLAMLEKDVEEVIEKAEGYEKDRRERMTNGILLGIGVLAVFSALIDATDFIEKLYGSGKQVGMGDLPHILIYLLIILIVAAGVIIGVHHSKRKK